jgi:hypothetical protein
VKKSPLQVPPFKGHPPPTSEYDHALSFHTGAPRGSKRQWFRSKLVTDEETSGRKMNSPRTE